MIGVTAWDREKSDRFGLNSLGEVSKLTRLVLMSSSAGVVGWTRSHMMAVNLGTLGPRDAAELVEYCNLPGGTHWSEARRLNGEHRSPRG